MDAQQVSLREQAGLRDRLVGSLGRGCGGRERRRARRALARGVAREHIPGAINLPHRAMRAESVAAIDRTALVVTYCDGIGCNASTKGALAMTRLGFRVKELIGGLDWWKRDGHPTSSGEATDVAASAAATSDAGPRRLRRNMATSRTAIERKQRQRRRTRRRAGLRAQGRARRDAEGRRDHGRHQRRSRRRSPRTPAPAR